MASNGWQRWAVRLTVIALAGSLATGLIRVIIDMRDHYTKVDRLSAEVRQLQDSMNALARRMR